MTKTRVNTQHHYVSLVVEWSKEERVTLTISHSGTRASAKPDIDKTAFGRMFKAFDKATSKDGHGIVGTVGERVEAIRKLAEVSKTPLVFAQLLEEAVANGAMPLAVVKPVLVDNLLIKEPKIAAAIAANPVANPPLEGEGSGKFIQRLWMAGCNNPDLLVALVLQHYPNRKTTRSDIAFNVSALRRSGVANVPAWPKAAR